MYVKKVLSCLLALLLIQMCGCGAQKLPDTYVANSDFQYMQTGGGTFLAGVQQADEGCYVICKGYLYYMDEKAGIMLPLCNKADCLHDKEAPLPDTVLTEEACDRLERCSACVDIRSDIDLGIAYSDGYLYCLNPSVISREGGKSPALFRCALDGSQKEIIYRWDNNMSIGSWCIHRGVLYYVEETFVLEKSSDVKKIFTLYSLPLYGAAKVPEVIYTPDGDLTVQSFGDIRAYGNHLYYSIIAYAPGDNVLSEENFMEYMHNKTFVYDITSQQLGTIEPAGMSKYESVQNINFWQNRIIFNVHDASNPDKETLTLYTADLDGANMESLMEEAPRQYACDGQYLYLTDSLLSYRKGQKGTYWVYDGDMELVDTFQLPYDNFLGYGRAIGGYPQAYIPIFYQWDVQQDWSLAHWDKNMIGTYNGSEIEVNYITR